MTEVDRLLEQVLESEGIHAFVLVCEAVDKYLPMIDSLALALSNGQVVKAATLDPRITKKVEETRRMLKREDRIVWALRTYKKALVTELLWLVSHEPEFIESKTGVLPAPEQPGLQRQLFKLQDIDIWPFQANDPDDEEATEPPYSGFEVIDSINEHLGRYLKIYEDYGETEPDNPINRLVFQQQPVGEVIAVFRRGQVMLMRKYYANWEAMPELKHPYDKKDSEGGLETILTFPNGWRWFDLHRNCSVLHGEKTMGHCGNTAAKGDVTIYELAEPIRPGDPASGKPEVWKPHATFIFNPHNGTLGEMKGRKNQKPSPRLFKYIFELLMKRTEINGLQGSGYAEYNNFALRDLPRHYLQILKRDRPELWQNSAEGQLPEDDV